MTDLLDARGVPIAPGDTALYGFGVGRSVAMAEAVVLAEQTVSVTGDPEDPDIVFESTSSPKVSLTPSGRVRLRVIRRSYADGEKPVVDVAPDRLVVLKSTAIEVDIGEWEDFALLPPSPLPTQDEEVRRLTEDAIASYTRGLRRTEVPEHFSDMTLEEYHLWCGRQLDACRKKLRALDDAT